MMDNQNTEFNDEQWALLDDLLGLPGRQHQIARLLFDGHSDQQMAQTLKIALTTVRSQIQRLYARLYVQDRDEFVQYIIRIHQRSTDNIRCDCVFFREEPGKLAGHETTTNRHPRNYSLTISFCAHPTKSPWDRTAAIKDNGATAKLMCGGLISECPLTEDERTSA
jgi:DNA-binding CsgD family transcriptional regulator